MLAEGGMHVPFLISWPGSIASGTVYEHPVSALDVAATAVSVADITVKSGDLDGVDLIPFLSGKRTEPPHESLMWRWSAQSAIREGNWKLLRGGEREYLFDLASDIEEKHNRATSHPEVANRLRGKLTAWCNELQPPGLAVGPMAKAWNDYFDFYLDGKPAPPDLDGNTDSPKSQSAGGWQARGGTLMERDGILEFKSAGAKGFITRNGLHLKPPTTVKLTTKSAEKGELVFAWRVDGEQEFKPAHQLKVPVEAANEWRSQSISLPGAETIVHLRIHLPKGSVQIREIELR